MPFNANFMSSRGRASEEFPCNKFMELHSRADKNIHLRHAAKQSARAIYMRKDNKHQPHTTLYRISLGCGRCTLSQLACIAVTHKESFRRKMREAIYIHWRHIMCLCARRKRKIFPSAASSRYIILLHAGSMHC